MTLLTRTQNQRIDGVATLKIIRFQFQPIFRTITRGVGRAHGLHDYTLHSGINGINMTVELLTCVQTPCNIEYPASRAISSWAKMEVSEQFTGVCFTCTECDQTIIKILSLVHLRYRTKNGVFQEYTTSIKWGTSRITCYQHEYKQNTIELFTFIKRSILETQIPTLDILVAGKEFC